MGAAVPKVGAYQKKPIAPCTKHMLYELPQDTRRVVVSFLDLEVQTRLSGVCRTLRHELAATVREATIARLHEELRFVQTTSGGRLDRLFYWDATEDGFVLANGGWQHCFAFSHRVHIEGVLHITESGTSTIVRPVVRNAPDISWFPLHLCGSLLHNAELFSTELSIYEGAMGDGTLWYRQCVPISMVVHTLAGVELRLDGDIVVPANYGIEEAYKTGRNAFSMRTHITWDAATARLLPKASYPL